MTPIPFSKYFSHSNYKSSLTDNSETNLSRQHCTYNSQSLCTDYFRIQTPVFPLWRKPTIVCTPRLLYPPLSNKQKWECKLRQPSLRQIKLLTNLVFATNNLLFILLEITNKNWLFYANKTKVGSIIFISIQNV